LQVVEVQQTFYQPPRVATLEKWRLDAPANFEFTLEAWQESDRVGWTTCDFDARARGILEAK
jgi:uncharacterized protein YecE (DUF72 family)